MAGLKFSFSSREEVRHPFGRIVAAIMNRSGNVGGMARPKYG